MFELTLLKELMLIRQAKSLDKVFNFQQHVCNGCHDLLMTSMKLSSVVISNIKGADYHCIISGINKSETINLFQNINLTEKT